MNRLTHKHTHSTNNQASEAILGETVHYLRGNRNHLTPPLPAAPCVCVCVGPLFSFSLSLPHDADDNDDNISTRMKRVFTNKLMCVRR